MVPADEGYGPIFIDEQVEDIPAEPSTVPAGVDRLTQLQIQDRRNKQILQSSQPATAPERRRFVDDQKNAERVEWGESTQPRSPVLPRTSQIRQGKRPAPFVEDDDDDDQQVTQDEGFEQDQRVANNSRRQRAPTAKRLRIEEPRPPRPRAEPSSAAPAPPQLDSDEEEQLAAATSGEPSAYTYRTVNALAKDYSRLAAPKSQNRVRWTAAEENALLDYIKEVGCSWARIKRQDETVGRGILGLRDQVALKDKARNMKFDFLRAGVELPENFAGVTLNSTQKNRLMGMGIEDF